MINDCSPKEQTALLTVAASVFTVGAALVSAGSSAAIGLTIAGATAQAVGGVPREDPERVEFNGKTPDAIMDGTMTAELSNGTDVRLRMAPGWYERCTEHELEQRLGNLARLLWAARTREYWATIAEVTGDHAIGEDKPISPRDLEFAEARDALVAQGGSVDGRIAISVTGLRRWTVRIASGTVRALDERAFAAAVGQAAADLIQDQFRKIAELRHRIYGDWEG